MSNVAATDYLKNLQTINRSFKRISKQKIRLCDKSVKEDNTIVKNIPHIDVDKMSPEDVPSQPEKSDVPADKKDKKDTIVKQAKKRCFVHGCKAKHHAKGYCKKHYRRMKDKPVKTCSIKGCKGRHHAKGYCHAHYRQIVDNESVKKCSYEGCKAKHHAKGFCKKHYRCLYETKRGKKKVVTNVEPIVKTPTKPIEVPIKETETVAPAVMKPIAAAVVPNASDLVPDENFINKVKARIFGNDEEVKKPIIREPKYSAPIFTEPEENLTERQKEDLKAHYAAVKRLDEMAKNPRAVADLLWSLTKH